MSNKESFKKVSISPFYTNKKNQTARFFWTLILLSLQIILLFVTKSYSSLVIILLAVLGALLAVIPELLKKEHLNRTILYAITTGVLVGFFIPPSFNPFSIFFITALFMFIIQLLFGGLGVSCINPIALIVAVAWFIARAKFPEFMLTISELTEKNPSLFLIQNMNILSVDEKITAFLNNSVFKLFNVSIPNGYVSFFWDSHAEIPAFRFNFLTLLSSIVLIGFNIQEGLIPMLYIVVYSLLVKFVSPLILGAPPLSGDVLLALLSSGTLFTAFFLLQWIGTVPKTTSGKVIYGIIAGIVMFAFSGAGTSPVGSIMTVLLMNIISPLIQLVEQNHERKQIAEKVKKIKE